jgi:hypothetical protein
MPAHACCRGLSRPIAPAQALVYSHARAAHADAGRRWRHAKVALELLREMALVGEACLQGDLSQREVRLLQQRLRALHALAQDVLMRVLADRAAEQTGEMVGTVATLLRQVVKGEALAEVGLDEVDDALNLSRRQTPLRGLTPGQAT